MASQIDGWSSLKLASMVWFCPDSPQRSVESRAGDDLHSSLPLSYVPKRLPKPKLEHESAGVLPLQPIEAIAGHFLGLALAYDQLC